jgi:TetR/AcrR family acrAB operon transcriptional repressor
MPRRTKEEAEQTRKDLLDAALSVFSQKGFQVTRLEDIAAEAGVTRGAIYHHFGSKAGLYIALMEDVSTVLNRIIEDAMQAGSSFVDVFASVIIQTLRELQSDRRTRQVLELLYLRTGYGPELNSVIEAQRQEERKWVEVLAQSMHAGIEVGELREDLDPLEAARAYISFQNGLINTWLRVPDLFSIEESAEALVEVFMRGLASK